MNLSFSNSVDAYYKNNTIDKTELHLDNKDIIVDFEMFRKIEDQFNIKFYKDCKLYKKDPKLYLNELILSKNKELLQNYGIKDTTFLNI